MYIRTTVASTTYSVGQIALGLLLHPYQTMQSLVQEKVFVWMVLLPSAVLAVVTMVWRAMGVGVAGEMNFAMLTFFSDWFTFFCLYWQILLLYLFFRFWNVFESRRA